MGFAGGGGGVLRVVGTVVVEVGVFGAELVLHVLFEDVFAYFGGDEAGHDVSVLVFSFRFPAFLLVSWPERGLEKVGDGDDGARYGDAFDTRLLVCWRSGFFVPGGNIGRGSGDGFWDLLWVVKGAEKKGWNSGNNNERI